MGGVTPNNTGPKLGVGGYLMQEFHEARDFVNKELDKGVNAIVSFVTTNSGLTGQAATALKANNDRINAALDGNDLPAANTTAPSTAPKP